MTPDERIAIAKEIMELEEKVKHVKGETCEIYSRVVGYFRPVKNWNKGKVSEWKERVTYDLKGEVNENKTPD